MRKTKRFQFDRATGSYTDTHYAASFLIKRSNMWVYNVNGQDVESADYFLGLKARVESKFPDTK